MTRLAIVWAFLWAVALGIGAGSAAAQDTAQAGDRDASVAQAGPAGAVADELPDPATLQMPDLRFTPTPEIEADYDKYFYFHRPDTSFAEAYADIQECDALASGVSFYSGASTATASAFAQSGVLVAGIGSAVGSLVADAIFGSAERRKIRRANMRNCMNFKEYRRYGVAREPWQAFNFEEGLGRKREGERKEALQLQALVAAGPVPAGKELGL